MRPRECGFAKEWEGMEDRILSNATEMTCQMVHVRNELRTLIRHGRAQEERRAEKTRREERLGYLGGGRVCVVGAGSVGEELRLFSATCSRLMPWSKVKRR